MRRLSAALVTFVVALAGSVAITPSASAIPGNLTAPLDAADPSTVSVPTRVVGASTLGGVQVAEGGYGALSPTLRPGTQKVINGAATTTLTDLTASGFSRGNGLVGQFSTSLEPSTDYSRDLVAYEDLNNPLTIHGSSLLPLGTHFVAGGPHGWAQYVDGTRQLVYVQPAGGSADPMPVNTMLTLGPPGQVFSWTQSGSNTTGVLLGSNCNGGCSSTSVLRFVPFDGSPATVLVDPASTLAAPVATSSRRRAPLTSLACISGTSCLAIDEAGGLATTATATAGASGWGVVSIDAGHRLVDLSCPTSGLCVAIDDTGSRLFSTNPMGGASAWSAPTQVAANSLLSISCATATLCVAGDSAGQVIVTTAPTGSPIGWVPRAVSSLGPISAVSCAPASAVCVALDGSQNAYANGNPASSTSAWSTSVVDNSGNFQPADVTCATATFCLIGENNGQTSINTAPTTGAWSTPHDATTANMGPTQPISFASCESPTMCVLADNQGNFWRSTNPNDPAFGNWSAIPVTTTGRVSALGCTGTGSGTGLCLAGTDTGTLATSTNDGVNFDTPAAISTITGNALAGIACPTAGACFAVDGAGSLAASSTGGSSWSTPFALPLTPFDYPSDLACPDATHCIVITQSGVTASASTDPSVAGNWQPLTVGGTSQPPLQFVSCPAVSLCVAVDYNGSAWRSTDAFTVGTWSGPTLIGGGINPSGLSCPTATLCLLSARNGHVFHSNPTAGPAWTDVALPTFSLSTVACASANLCLATNDSGNMFTTSNPAGAASAWTQTNSNTFYSLQHLSCPSTTLCIGADYQNIYLSTTPSTGAPGFSSGVGVMTGSQAISGLACVPAATRCVVAGDAGDTVLIADATQTIPVPGSGTDTAVDDYGDVAWVVDDSNGASSNRTIYRTKVSNPQLIPFAAACAFTPVVTSTRTFWQDCNGALQKRENNTTTQVTPTVPGTYVTGMAASADTVYWTMQDGTRFSLTDGSGTITPVVPAFEPVAIRNVALSPGRVAYTDDAQDPAAAPAAFPTWSRTLTNSVGTFTAGGPSVVAHSTSGPSLSISGTRTLSGDNAGAGLRLVSGSSATTVVTAAQQQYGTFGYNGYAGPHLSGMKAIYPAFDVANNTVVWRLYDAATGSTTTPTGANTWRDAHLWGRYLSSINNSREVDLRDLTTGANTVVAQAPVLGANEFFDGPARVTNAGRAVAWFYDVFNNVTNQVTRFGGYVKDATGPSPASDFHALSFGAASEADVALSRQYVVQTSPTGVGLVATKLSDGSDAPMTAVLPDPAFSFAPNPLAIDRNVVGYETSAGIGQVEQLPATTTDPPVVLSGKTPTAYTIGGGRTWIGDVVTSAPLTSCSFDIKQGATLIKTLSCDAPAMDAGEALASPWNGTNTLGVGVAAGTYTWTLNAAGTDGTLLPSDMVGAPVTGNVAVSPVTRVVAVALPANTASAFTLTFDHDVFGASGSNAKLIGATTTTALPSSLRCLSAAGATVSCAGPARKLAITPTTAIPGGTYRVAVNSGVSTLVDAGTAPVTPYTSGLVRIKTADNPAFSQAWATVATASAIGARYSREHRVGATFTATFTGTGVRYWYVKGPDAGKVKILIDGVLKNAGLDEYATARSYHASATFTGLSSATHTLQVVALGTHRTGATDSFVSVDAVSTPTATCTTTTGCTQNPSGFRWTIAGVASLSDVLGASMSRTFYGTGFDLYRLVGPGQGEFSLSVDGHAVTVNDYAAANAVTAYTRTGLANGTHSLVVTVLHVTGRAGTAAFSVGIDRVTAR